MPPPIPQHLIYASWGYQITMSTFVLIFIYGNLKLYYYRTETFLQKRSLFAVFGLNISLLFAILSHMGIIYAQTERNKDYFAYAISSYFASWFSIWTFLNTKNFLIFFKDKWTFYTLQLKWHKIINETSENANFFLRN
eukprot:172429_1